MEKTLRELIATRIWGYPLKHCAITFDEAKTWKPNRFEQEVKDCYTDADFILSSLQARIKAKALTQHQLLEQYNLWKEYTTKPDAYLTWSEWLAAAQLQAVLGELE